jgi:hypothetical protein
VVIWSIGKVVNPVEKLRKKEAVISGSRGSVKISQDVMDLMKKEQHRIWLETREEPSYSEMLRMMWAAYADKTFSPTETKEAHLSLDKRAVPISTLDVGQGEGGEASHLHELLDYVYRASVEEFRVALLTSLEAFAAGIQHLQAQHGTTSSSALSPGSHTKDIISEVDSVIERTRRLITGKGGTGSGNPEGTDADFGADPWRRRA